MPSPVPMSAARASVPEPVVEMSFVDAIDVLLSGGCVTRQSWGDPRVYITIRDSEIEQKQPNGEVERRPEAGVLCIVRPSGYGPLYVRQVDMEGSDWVVVRPVANVPNAHAPAE